MPKVIDLTWNRPHGTMVHCTSFDQSCHQVNLACLRDGVAVLGGGGGGYGTVFQSKFNNLFMVWCMVFIHSTSVYILIIL